MIDKHFTEDNVDITFVQSLEDTVYANASMLFDANFKYDLKEVESLNSFSTHREYQEHVAEKLAGDLWDSLNKSLIEVVKSVKFECGEGNHVTIAEEIQLAMRSSRQKFIEGCCKHADYQIRHVSDELPVETVNESK